MPLLFALLVAWITALLPTQTHADGVHVKRVIGLDALVKKSGLIFTATIVATDHQRASRMAYGRDQAYIESFRFKLAVDTVLRGENDPKPAIPVWLSQKGETPPGKWALIEEAYHTSFSPRDAKAGDRVVVFLRQGRVDQLEPKQVLGEILMVFVDEIESIDRLAAIKRTVAKVGKPTVKP